MQLGNQQGVETGTVSIDQPATPRILADIAASFTYASYQNAVPVLRGISVENHSERQFEKLRLELTSTPAFLRQKTWTIDCIVPGDRLPFGVERLTASSRARLDEALLRARGTKSDGEKA